jgi:heme-degrading monooxygenase HmoA
MEQKPEPPYYAVIFISRLNPSAEGYDEMARKMLDLAAGQPGFLGVESARSGVGITVSFWKDRESIRLWRQQADHRLARKLGREKWYQSYEIHIARVEEHRDYRSSADCAGS